MRKLITSDYVKSLLAYDKDTGEFRWKINFNNSIRAGSKAGCKHSAGYLLIGIDGKQYFAHRLAWLYIHGDWPINQIDHINGIRDDNRLCNLRDINQSLNNQNQRKASKNSSSGILGVSPYGDKWVAKIKFGPKVTHLGTFSTLELAEKAYLDAKRKYHQSCSI